jgi:hypothetical protein
MVEKYYVDKWYLTLLMLQGLHKFSLSYFKINIIFKNYYRIKIH